jgi:putative transposase
MSCNAATIAKRVSFATAIALPDQPSRGGDPHRCAIHAYVLMTNHVHLLLAPAVVGGVGLMMQALGRNFVTFINVHYRRTGTLWEGRYKSCRVDSDDYLLACYRYIELNPVRAGMVPTPGDYVWSSYRPNAMGAPDSLLQPHAQYLALGTSAASRQAAYRDLFAEAIDVERLAEIRAYVQQQKALGTTRFQIEIEAAVGRSMLVGPAHRPRGRRDDR